MEFFTIHTYDREPEALSIDDAAQIHDQMIFEMGEDLVAKEYYRLLLEASIEYIDIRTKWAIQTKEENHAMNDTRTKKHNAVIYGLDELANYLCSMGYRCAWRDRICYEKDGKYFRKRCGDFGCYLAFLASLSTR